MIPPTDFVIGITFPLYLSWRTFKDEVRALWAQVPRVAHLDLTWIGGSTNVFIATPFTPKCADLGYISVQGSAVSAVSAERLDWRVDTGGIVIRQVEGLVGGIKYDITIRVEEAI